MHRDVRISSFRYWPWVFGTALLCAMPVVGGGSSALNLSSQICIAVIACLSFNILFGQGGMLSFGHAVYTGLGAYATIHVLNAVNAGHLYVPVSLMPLVGGLAGLAFAALTGWVTTRKSGTSFSMITLAVCELVYASLLAFPTVSGGEGGISGSRSAGTPWMGITFGPQLQLYYLIALYTLLCAGLMFAFTRTPLGLMLNAVRDNAERAGFIGVHAGRVRYSALVIAGFFAGVAGGLSALQFEIVTAEVASASRSGAFLLFVFLGGASFFWGPILGAVLMVLAFNVLSNISQAWLLYLGLMFITLVMFAPGGLAALLVQWLQQWRRQQSPTEIAVGLAWIPTSLFTLTGALTMLELAYRWRLGDAYVPGFHFFGLGWSVSVRSDWYLALGWTALGALMTYMLLNISKRYRTVARLETP